MEEFSLRCATCLGFDAGLFIRLARSSEACIFERVCEEDRLQDHSGFNVAEFGRGGWWDRVVRYGVKDLDCLGCGICKCL